jgi:3-deoxy-D-manno-octulosonic acid (KDO) 8-phosphate synthase
MTENTASGTWRSIVEHFAPTFKVALGDNAKEVIWTAIIAVQTPTMVCHSRPEAEALLESLMDEAVSCGVVSHLAAAHADPRRVEFNDAARDALVAKLALKQLCCDEHSIKG